MKDLEIFKKTAKEDGAFLLDKERAERNSCFQQRGARGRLTSTSNHIEGPFLGLDFFFEEEGGGGLGGDKTLNHFWLGFW